MTTTREQYQPGSFRNISFLVPSETKTGGPKVVRHEYPNSDVRFTEDLGLTPPIFDMICIIHGDTSINKRLQFENALNQGGIGTLVHPVYGTLEVKVGGTYTVSSNQNKMGEHRFTVPFDTTEENVTATPSAVDESEISANTNATTTALDDTLEEVYENPSFGDSLNAMADNITELAQDVNNLIKTVVSPIQENVAAFNRVVSSIETGAHSIIASGETFKSTIEDLYDGFMDIVNFPNELLEAWQNLVDFNIGDNTPKTNTSKRAEIANNTNATKSQTRLNALARTFEAAAYSSYTTASDIDTIRQYLDEKYKELVLVQTDSISPDARSNFATLRNNVTTILNQKEQNVWKTTEVNLNKSSMLLMSFKYYGDLDNVDLLQQLNPELNSAYITDQMDILTK